MIEEQVRDAYLARWGDPTRVARFEVQDLAVEVLKWAVGANPEGVNLYATVGASARPLPGADANHRIELFIGLLPARDEIASPLAALALYSERMQVRLGHGDTVPGDEPLWKGTEMRRFLVLRPVGDAFPPIDLPGDVHVEFLQAIPLFESEARFKAANSVEALMDRWKQSNMPFWDPKRKPMPAT
jgi:hypothetical protein